MKWIIGTIAVLILGWMATVYLFNHTGVEAASLASTDSLQAKAPPLDSTVAEDKKRDVLPPGTVQLDTLPQKQRSLAEGRIDTKGVQPKDVVAYAETLIGVPYLYGSTNPAKGFDCSGFITYVFRQFDILVPRSSIDFTHVGTEVSAVDAKAGDLILFTGTNANERFVGHMGIVVDNTDSLRFIHSTSGKQFGVTITPMSNYYKTRYVKTVRVFPQNG